MFLHPPFSGVLPRRFLPLGADEERENAMNATSNYGASAAAQDVITLDQLQIRYLRDGASEGQSGAFEMIIPPGSRVPPPHSHTHNEEYLYVLDGTIRYSVDGEVRDLSPGESAFTPKGSVHGFSNPFSAVCRAL